MIESLASIVCLLLALTLGVCDAPVADPSNSQGAIEATGLPVLDVGDVDNFNSCNATPRRPLSAQDVCKLEILVKHCTPAADCLVSCISSPDGRQVGGGCEHVCFRGPHDWSERPQSIDKCDSLPSDHHG